MRAASMVAWITVLGASGAARAEEPRVGEVARPLVLPAGQAEVTLALGASNAPDDRGDAASFGAWLGLRAHGAIGLGRRWQVGIEALLALDRPFDVLQSNGSIGDGATPLKRFGGYLVEVLGELRPDLGVRLRAGEAWPGAFGRGPLRQPDFRQLDEASYAEMHAAASLTFPLKLALGPRGAAIFEPGVFWHSRGDIDDGAYAAYASVQLPVAVVGQVDERVSLGVGTGWYRGPDETHWPAYGWVQVSPERHVDLAVEAGVHSRKPRYNDTERHAFLGLVVRARR